ncbi:MAG: hypothetical protein AABW80_04860 [Nanoarchaeota archaeon]
MKITEYSHLLAAMLVIFVVAGFSLALKGQFNALGEIFIYSVVIIAVVIGARKFVAHLLDADVEHEIWQVYTYGFKPRDHFEKEKPFGIIIPLLLSIISLGFLKFLPVLTYETSAQKVRASKRFGYYSYSSMTGMHNALIGVAGIVALWILAIIAYLVNFEYLAEISAYYAFANLIPISSLDGTQIFFGSKVLYTIVATITLIFFLYAIFLI